MPKVFLVKRRSPGVSVRSWDELPDEERADTYIPVGLGRLLHDPPEDCRSDGGSSSSSSGGGSSAGEPGGAESSSSPRAPEHEIPEPGDAEGPGGHLAATQRPVARSKIKVWCRLCPRRHLHHALASGSGNRRRSLQLPPAHPDTGAPRHRARPPRGSCTCLWVSARAFQARPPACWVASGPRR